MTGLDRLIFLRPVVRIKEIVELLATHDFSTFPVAEDAKSSSGFKIAQEDRHRSLCI